MLRCAVLCYGVQHALCLAITLPAYVASLERGKPVTGSRAAAVVAGMVASVAALAGAWGAGRGGAGGDPERFWHDMTTRVLSCHGVPLVCL